MRPLGALSLYLGRQFLFWFLCLAFALLAVIMLVDMVEIFRRVSQREHGGGILVVLGMVLLKAPSMFEKAIPFAALLGTAAMLWRLNRHHEIVVMRASGVSIWQILAPVVALAIAIGVVKVAVINPFSSAALLNYEVLEAKHIRGRTNLAAVARNGLWFRQSLAERSYILHARSISIEDVRLKDVVVFRMRDGDKFVSRIDAPAAVLEAGHWRIEDPVIAAPDAEPARPGMIRLPTDLTPENINDSFAPPETISFWALPSFIRVLENAGFSGVRHKLHWHAELALPLLLAAVVLLAATFSLRPTRQRGGTVVVAASLGTAFLLYFLTDVAHALGTSTKIPILMAAWAPVLVGLFAGVGILLHFEDG